jgi:hypothetical protein
MIEPVVCVTKATSTIPPRPPQPTRTRILGVLEAWGGMSRMSTISLMPTRPLAADTVRLKLGTFALTGNCRRRQALESRGTDVRVPFRSWQVGGQGERND